MTLWQVTGHESGIVVLKGGGVAVVDWSSFDSDQTPAIYAFSVFSRENEAGYLDAVEDGESVDDVRTALPGSIWLTGRTDEDGAKIADTDLVILCDENSELLRLFLSDEIAPDELTGKVYTLPDGVRLIVPDAWD